NTSPRSIFTEVLLPAPFGPKKPNTSPRGTSRVRFRTATLPPKTLRSPRVRMARSEDRVIYNWITSNHSIERSPQRGGQGQRIGRAATPHQRVDYSILDPQQAIPIPLRKCFCD